jgi:cation diffusion facilitator family transporter
MPDPQPQPQAAQVRRVAMQTLVGGAIIMALKFALFAYTHSSAVLSDALESIINLVAAGAMVYTIWLANQPADREHPYGHGKVEFMAIGLEGWLILSAGVVMLYQAVYRLIWPVHADTVRDRWQIGAWLLAVVALLVAGLAGYVYYQGRRFGNATLLADAKHLFTDAGSTIGGVIALYLVRRTGWLRLDPLIAILMAGIVFFTSWKLLWQSVHGLMDSIDPNDEAAIFRILDEEVSAGAIKGYHKVRHRHSGAFHWVDLHLQVDGGLSVRESHEIASRIEHRIEQMLGEANATAHMEPWIAEGAAPGAIAPSASEVDARGGVTPG